MVRAGYERDVVHVCSRFLIFLREVASLGAFRRVPFQVGRRCKFQFVDGPGKIFLVYGGSDWADCNIEAAYLWQGLGSFFLRGVSAVRDVFLVIVSGRCVFDACLCQEERVVKL